MRLWQDGVRKSHRLPLPPFKNHPRTAGWLRFRGYDGSGGRGTKSCRLRYGKFLTLAPKFEANPAAVNN